MLIQGPMLPKLRGRLFYRGIATNIPMLCLTYDANWLDRMVNQAIPRHEKSCIDAPHQRKLVTWEGPIPCLQIDQGSRSFIGWQDNRPRYHVEVLANNWNPSESKAWWDHKYELCRSLCHDTLFCSLLNESDLHARLLLETPWPMALIDTAVARHHQDVMSLERAIVNFTYLLAMSKRTKIYLSTSSKTLGAAFLEACPAVFPNAFSTTHPNTFELAASAIDASIDIADARCIRERCLTVEGEAKNKLRKLCDFPLLPTTNPLHQD